MKITVLSGNTIGGTEKAASLFASALARRGHAVCMLTTRNGPRTSLLEKAGVRIEDVACTSDALFAWIQKEKPDVIHQHVCGYGDHRALYHALDRCPEWKPKLIETNVFGRLYDRYDHDHVALRMFVSMASGCQAFRRPQWKRTSPSPQRFAILSYPIEPFPSIPSPSCYALRAELGIRPDEFILIRTGQPGGKWTEWECKAFQIARQANPNLRLILMEPYAEIAQRIRAGKWGDGIIVLKASSDFAFLSRLYRTANAMLHASLYGESFGYTLAEGMQAGLPIITLSTPWGDNAQVQLIKNGETGWVCSSCKGMAEAILDLAKNPSRCMSMGTAAAKRIDEVSNIESQTNLLEEVMHYVTGGPISPLMTRVFDQWMAYDQNGFDPAQSDVCDANLTLSYFLWHLETRYRKARSRCRFWLDCFTHRS
jgi:glycosyltransferase involved in cell wall biosynthesis